MRETADRPATARRASYGVDAPGVLIGLSVGALVTSVLTVLTRSIPQGIGAAFLVLCAASYAYATFHGKRAVWARELDQLDLRADAALLDVGCGRGAVLVRAARYVPEGRAVGIDLWRSIDQSGNSEHVTRANAEAEGVSEQVELLTGDMQELPFADDSFDLVVSSLAIHNVPSESGRAAAVSQAFRVTRPGGRLRLADIRHANAYAATLRSIGAVEVTTRGLGWQMWFGGPWYATRMVEATKPAS